MGNAHSPPTIQESLKKTKRVIARTDHKIDKAFKDSLKKTKRVTQRIDKKIENGFKDIGKKTKEVFSPTFGRQLSQGLTKTFGVAGNVLDKVTDVGDKIFDVPVLGNLLKVAAPEFYELNQGLKIADVGVKGLRDLTDLQNYEGDDGMEIAKNILERSVKVGVDLDKEGAFKYA
jgi:hypothetical protein